MHACVCFCVPVCLRVYVFCMLCVEGVFCVSVILSVGVACEFACLFFCVCVSR